MWHLIQSEHQEREPTLRLPDVIQRGTLRHVWNWQPDFWPGSCQTEDGIRVFVDFTAEMISQHCSLRAKKANISTTSCWNVSSRSTKWLFSFWCKRKVWKGQCDIYVGDTETPQLLGKHRELPDKNANLFISFYLCRDTCSRNQYHSSQHFQSGLNCITHPNGVDS